MISPATSALYLGITLPATRANPPEPAVMDTFPDVKELLVPAPTSINGESFDSLLSNVSVRLTYKAVRAIIARSHIGWDVILLAVCLYADGELYDDL